jgi:hypothetical protein
MYVHIEVVLLRVGAVAVHLRRGPAPAGVALQQKFNQPFLSTFPIMFAPSLSWQIFGFLRTMAP